MEKNVVGIIQARMGAARLPNKMMLHLHGYPIVEWVFRRTKKARFLSSLHFAIPDKPTDDILAVFLESLGCSVFRGSETDVVSRFYQAAKKNSATHIVRICADNPLICGKEIDHLIEFYFRHPCDYAYNNIPRGNLYPDGLGAEIVSFALLETIFLNARIPAQREHSLNYIWDNQEKYVIKTFDPPDKNLACPDLKLDIDSPEDYLKFLQAKLHPDMTSEEIVKAFSKQVGTQ